ncbi:MAG: biopolymer transporter ExbD [Pseudomonadota bacterium]
MTLAKPKPPSPRVTLVPLIDVLFILLVYFMVTSVYLDLDMIPAGGTAEDPQTNVPPTVTEAPQETQTLLLRIDASGQAVLRGQALGPDALRSALEQALAERPGLTVLILPSPVAPTQALATTLDALTQVGVRDTRLIRIEAEP